MSQVKTPSLLDALIPVIFLIILLFFSVNFYGDNSSYGANQIALLLAAGVAAIIGWKNGFTWKTIEQGITKGISTALGAILILLAVGSLIGTWILSGTVPTLIYFGLQLLEPSIFYAAACIICAMVSVSIGSSWTTAATVGVALIGVASGLGLSPEITAGAIISGAYFGDKMSPLSDTTNLAPAVAGAELFEHIRHMIWTTGPSIIIATIIFAAIGLFSSSSNSEETMMATLNLIDAHFNIGIVSLIPLIVVLVLAYKRMPAFPTIMIGALVGGLFAVFTQDKAIASFVGVQTSPSIANYVDAVWRALFDGYVIETTNQSVNSLLSRGGMSSMLNTVWLILCALTFGAVMEHTFLLQRLVTSALKMIHSTGSLVVTVVLTCIGVNVLAADQYIAIVLPGRMFKAEFNARKLASKNLSRTLEDSATITSPLIPWNTCGVYMSGTLQVATLAYLPFCFFNLINPVLSIIYGVYNFKIEKLEESEAVQ
ncbi:MAG: Na+/H+ antiporter NhaC [Gammaproteobacteria bacterium]|nr:Na+/H+ antiporter NhaC [Gammaproteobacteria bacterium]